VIDAIVTTPPPTDPSPGGTLKKLRSGVVEKQAGRKRRANIRISGPEWV
jgi:hypothetical protein